MTYDHLFQWRKKAGAAGGPEAAASTSEPEQEVVPTGQRENYRSFKLGQHENVWQSGESTGALDEKRLSSISSRFSSVKAKLERDTAKTQACSSHCPEPGTSQKQIAYDTQNF